MAAHSQAGDFCIAGLRVREAAGRLSSIVLALWRVSARRGMCFPAAGGCTKVASVLLVWLSGFGGSSACSIRKTHKHPFTLDSIDLASTVLVSI